MAYIAQIHLMNGRVRNIECRTITEARKAGEEYGTEASSVSILRRTRKTPWPCVARHVRDRNGDGMCWFKA